MERTMTPRTFAASLLDPQTGTTRDAVIEIGPRFVLVKLSPGRRRGEDGPHHAAADFTAQALEIAAALVDANEEREAARDSQPSQEIDEQ